MGLLGLLFLAHHRREQAAEARREIERLRDLASLGTLAVGFVHDLNNQLMVLLGSLDRARSSEELVPSIKPLLAQAAGAAGCMGEIAGRMLRLARNDPLVSSEFELEDLLQRVMANLNALSRGSKELRLNTADCPASMMGDATLLECALTNLGKNGLEALEGDGLLEIRTNVRDEQLSIVVEDNGPGIDPDKLDDLFIAFRTQHSKHGGTGLGLYMAKAAVEAHGGSISVEAAPDHGARFTVSLPLQRAAGA